MLEIPLPVNEAYSNPVGARVNRRLAALPQSQLGLKKDLEASTAVVALALEPCS